MKGNYKVEGNYKIEGRDSVINRARNNVCPEEAKEGSSYYHQLDPKMSPLLLTCP